MAAGRCTGASNSPAVINNCQATLHLSSRRLVWSIVQLLSGPVRISPHVGYPPMREPLSTLTWWCRLVLALYSVPQCHMETGLQVTQSLKERQPDSTDSARGRCIVMAGL